MKVLVTGGAGFIGSHVVDAFLEAGHEVVVVDNLSTGRSENLNPGARFYNLDIRDPALADVFEREKPEVVDHHAAQVDVRKSILDAAADADINIRGTLNVLECARRAGARKFIYPSSGGAIYGEPETLPCDERHPIRPICQYGVSKHVGEQYVFVYHHLYGLDFTILRYANVYGPRQNPYMEGGVVAVFAGRMLAGRPAVIFGTGEQGRDFVYAGDCARANVLAATGGGGGAYNIGVGHSTTVNEIFKQIKRITGYAAEPVYDPPKPGETFNIYLDSRRAKAELQWQPAVSLSEGLARTVEHFRVHERGGLQA
jgi:UDP-glucose 4-epimerase